MISNLNVLKKMLIIGVLTLIAFVTLGTIFLISEKNILVSEKKAKLTNIVELPYSLVESEYKAFQDGKIDEATAKQNALNSIKKLRYEAALKFGGKVEDQAKGRLLAALHLATLEPQGEKICLIIEDVLATLLELTVETVAQEVEKFGLTSLYVAGGGALNPFLMKRLQERAKDCKILTISELGISTQSKEAIAFALIGFLTMHGLPGQIPSCTGAIGSKLLGSLTPGKDPFHLPEASSKNPIRVRIIK